MNVQISYLKKMLVNEHMTLFEYSIFFHLTTLFNYYDEYAEIMLMIKCYYILYTNTNQKVLRKKKKTNNIVYKTSCFEGK